MQQQQQQQGASNQADDAQEDFGPLLIGRLEVRIYKDREIRTKTGEHLCSFITIHYTRH